MGDNSRQESLDLAHHTKRGCCDMTKVNQNFLKLPGSYLFSEVARRISAYSAARPAMALVST